MSMLWTKAVILILTCDSWSIARLLGRWLRLSRLSQLLMLLLRSSGRRWRVAALSSSISGSPPVLTSIRFNLFSWPLTVGQGKLGQGILKGKYHCTTDLLFDLFGLVCFASKNNNCQLTHNWFQTSQTGGQWYSDTSSFSIPWLGCLCSHDNYSC